MSRKLKAVNAVEGKSPFGGVSFTPKCPSCGRLSQNSMTPFGSPSSIPILCRNCGKRYEVSFSYEEDTSNSIRLEKVTYHNKMFFRDIDSLSAGSERLSLWRGWQRGECRLGIHRSRGCFFVR